jgi:hypothetical protein
VTASVPSIAEFDAAGVDPSDIYDVPWDIDDEWFNQADLEADVSHSEQEEEPW